MAKYRNFALELYPEDSTHLDILDFIRNNYLFAYILHDRDVWDNTVLDNDGAILHNVGELKKPHYHVIISFKNPRSLELIRDTLGINHLEFCNFYLYSRYLIHKDDPKKYQYKESEIITNMELRIHNALKRDYNSQEQDTRLLLDFIYQNCNQSFVTLKQLTDFAIENDCLLDLKRNIHFYKYFIDDIGFRRL